MCIYFNLFKRLENTPLLFSAGDFIGIAKLLIEAGANVNAKTG